MTSLTLHLPPIHAIRRTAGGARRALSARVLLRDGSRQIDGWTLNISRGGLRVIVEEAVSVDERFDLFVGSLGSEQVLRQGRVVWIQCERDGTIAGLEFLMPAGLTG
jgi:hypothetical protein